jgi:hypothetical protein
MLAYHMGVIFGWTETGERTKMPEMLLTRTNESDRGGRGACRPPPLRIVDEIV